MRIPLAGFLAAVALLFLLVFFWLTYYTVNETEQVIVTQFGRIVGEPVTEAGLHFRVPFLHQINRFEKRTMEWDSSPNEMPTKDKLYIVVDTYGRWRIVSPGIFFQRHHNVESAQNYIDDIIDSEVRRAVAGHVLLEIIRSVNREPEVEESLRDAGQQLGGLATINYGREQITREIVQNAQPILATTGIELLDVRIKRINYNERVQTTIYERMVSERQQIAERFRSEGQGEAARIGGEKERDTLQIQSEAYQKVQQIEGKADAEATSIYNAAYDSSPEARAFYQFQKSMETFSQTLGKDTMVILSTDNDLFRYLKSMEEETETPAARGDAGPAAAATAPAPGPAAQSWTLTAPDNAAAGEAAPATAPQTGLTHP